MHQKNLLTKGKELGKSSGALILLHGRGATAEDIIALADYFSVKDFTLIAPQATNYTWYPLSFLAPVEKNEPWLSSAITLLDEIVSEIAQAGIESERTYLAGFSQGACLALEFAARRARRWGGVAAFTGGLIGDTLQEDRYVGSFENTPVFIGTSDPDPHVPITRVRETISLLKNMKASVQEKIYKNMGHTIHPEELALADNWIFTKANI